MKLMLLLKNGRFREDENENDYVRSWWSGWICMKVEKHSASHYHLLIHSYDSTCSQLMSPNTCEADGEVSKHDSIRPLNFSTLNQPRIVEYIKYSTPELIELIELSRHNEYEMRLGWNKWHEQRRCSILSAASTVSLSFLRSQCVRDLMGQKKDLLVVRNWMQWKLRI